MCECTSFLWCVRFQNVIIMIDSLEVQYMETYIMAIDQGTTSTRAMLFDKESNIIGIAQKELENFILNQAG